MADKKISALPPASTPLAGTEVLPIVQGGATDQVSVANLTAGRDMATKAITVTQTTVGSGGFKIAAELLASDYPAARFLNTTANDGALIGWDTDHFSIATNTTNGLAGTERLGIFKTSGDVKVNTGNLVIGTAGKGIDFSANTHAAGMTSELLNDYEEGVISIGATCDSGTITLSTNTLYYTKVGRMIHVTGKIVVDSVSSPTGNVYFGLPIVAGVSSAVTLYMSNTNTIAGKIPVGVINAGQTIFYVQTLDQVTGIIGGAASIFKAGTEFTFSASYI